MLKQLYSNYNKKFNQLSNINAAKGKTKSDLLQTLDLDGKTKSIDHHDHTSRHNRRPETFYFDPTVQKKRQKGLVVTLD